jgi:transcriptional regulator with XRE-family HTH domain
MSQTQADQSLAAVIGKNARHLRIQAGLTLDQVALAAKQRGMKWSESRVADFEAGKVAPNLTTLISVCLALADLGCKATLPDLVTSGQPIQISESLCVYEDELLRLLSRRRPSRRGSPTAKEQPPDKRVTPEWGDEPIMRAEKATGPLPLAPSSTTTDGATEARVRKSLGISLDQLAELSTDLWGRSFSEERDRRARKGANAQARGQVSRRMLTELARAMERADGRQNQVTSRKKN